MDQISRSFRSRPDRMCLCQDLFPYKADKHIKHDNVLSLTSLDPAMSYKRVTVGDPRESMLAQRRARLPSSDLIEGTPDTSSQEHLSSSEPRMFKFDEELPESYPEQLTPYASGAAIPSVGAYARLAAEAPPSQSAGEGPASASDNVGGVALPPGEQPTGRAQQVQSTDMQRMTEMLERIADTLEELVKVVQARTVEGSEPTLRVDEQQ